MSQLTNRTCRDIKAIVIIKQLTAVPSNNVLYLLKGFQPGAGVGLVLVFNRKVSLSEWELCVQLGAKTVYKNKNITF